MDLGHVRSALQALKREGDPKWADRTARELVKDIKRTAPKDTGQYRTQWAVRQRKRGVKYKTVIHISPGTRKLPVPYNYDRKTYADLWKWLEDGTIPHEIRPRKARILRFEYPQGSGQIMYRHVVQHPGTKPTRHAAKSMRRVLPREMKRTIKDVKKRHIWLKR